MSQVSESATWTKCDPDEVQPPELEQVEEEKGRKRRLTRRNQQELLTNRTKANEKFQKEGCGEGLQKHSWLVSMTLMT